jgi:hypothetical protein
MAKAVRQKELRSSKPGGRGGEKPSPGWKSRLKQPIFLVLVISLAVHALFLLAFGSVAIFRGSIPKLPFLSQEVAVEEVVEVPPPPMEEADPLPEDAPIDPFAQEVTEAKSAEEDAPVLEMITAVGGVAWAPSVPKTGPVSETGSLGTAGQGTGSGAAASAGKGPTGLRASKQLFGVTIRARKLGVVVSVNQRAQNQGVLPGIFDEIFREFPEADIFLTNGGGMMDWSTALQQFEDKVEARKKKEKETGKRIPGANHMEKPKVARFNSGEAMDWPPVRGSPLDEDYVGLKVKHPELFQALRKRNNVWFITSYKEANSCHLAFEELIRKGAEAIYWYNAFDSPIEGRAADDLAQKIGESKIEILVQNQGSRTQGLDWLKRVEAKFVK